MRVQGKGTQRLLRGVNPHIPDIRLMARALEEATIAKEIHVGIPNVGRRAHVAISPIEPAAGDFVAAQCDLGARNLVGKQQLPTERADLRRNIG